MTTKNSLREYYRSRFDSIRESCGSIVSASLQSLINTTKKRFDDWDDALRDISSFESLDDSFFHETFHDLNDDDEEEGHFPSRQYYTNENEYKYAVLERNPHNRLVAAKSMNVRGERQIADMKKRLHWWTYKSRREAHALNADTREILKLAQRLNDDAELLRKSMDSFHERCGFDDSIFEDKEETEDDDVLFSNSTNASMMDLTTR